MENRAASLIVDLDRKLIDNHLSDRELFIQMDNAQEALGIVSGGRPFSPFLRPEIFTRSFYDRIVRAAEVLAEAFDLMTMAALESDAIMAELGLTEKEEYYARIDPGYKGVCNSSRLDAFISGDRFSFLEYNGETPAGITDQMQIEKMLEAVPEVRSFLDENAHWLPRPHVKLLEALVAGYRDFGGRSEKPNIAIVDWKGVSTYTEFEVLKEYFESQGHQTVISDPASLEYDGSVLRSEGIVVDIFYKRVLIHEFLDREPADHPFLRAYEDGNVFMANSFRSKIPHKKASLAVLSNDRYSSLFTDEQLDTIEAHIPWTRLVSDREVRFGGAKYGLLSLIRRERDKFILKPNDDYGGSGITVGWETTESDWDDAIERSLVEPYIVQERAPVDKVLFPTYDGKKAYLEELLIDFDPFLFRGRAEGGLIRLSSNSLVNVAAGGGEAALAVLEEY
jgi:hypothetical protein